jgi:hypothetical protein
MNARNHIPATVSARLEARIAPFQPSVCHPPLEDLDVETARAVAPDERKQHSRLIADLKLLFAALGAGGSVVPLGDNHHTARLLSSYAASLRDH